MTSFVSARTLTRTLSQRILTIPRAQVLLKGALFLALIALLISASSFTRGAHTERVLAAGGVLTLSQTSGAPGTHLFLSGGGFTTKELVDAYWNYTGPGTGIVQKSFYGYNPTVVADASGNANSSFWVSATHAGAYTVALVGRSSGVVDTASFQLTPHIDLGEYVGPAGTTLRFQGWGFGAKEAVVIYWQYQQGDQALAAKAATDSKGDWSGKTFFVPLNEANGVYTLTAIGQTSGVVATSQFTVGAVPAGLAPQTSDWASFGYNLQGTRVNPTETTISASNASTLAVKWASSTLVTPAKIMGSPVVANGIVYIGTVEGNVLAYNSANGSLLWQFSASAPIYGSPTVANGLLYFGTVKNPSEDTIGNAIYCLNASTGALVWENYLKLGSMWTPPTVNNGVVYALTALKEGISGGFYAFDALTGQTIWSVATPSGNWSVPIIDPSGSNLYIATGNPCLANPPAPQDTPQTDGCSGSLFDLNPATGATVWQYHFPDYTGDDDAPATPAYAVVNGVPELFEGVKNGIFYCINATNGQMVWQYDTGNRGDNGIYSSAAYYNSVLYFGGYKTLYALNASDGTPSTSAWSWQPAGTIVSSPNVANGVLYVTTESGYIVGYDLTTGNEVWKYLFPKLPGTQKEPPIYSSSIVSNGVVYVSVSDGYLYAFSLGGV